MKHRLLPGWARPPLEAAIGVGFGYNVGRGVPDSPLILFVLFGAILGGLGGSLVWLDDWLTVRRGFARLEREKLRPRKPKPRPVLLPVLACAIGWIPIVGLVLSIIAYRQFRGRSAIATYSFAISGPSTLGGLMLFLYYYYCRPTA